MRAERYSPIRFLLLCLRLYSNGPESIVPPDFHGGAPKGVRAPNFVLYPIRETLVSLVAIGH